MVSDIFSPSTGQALVVLSLFVLTLGNDFCFEKRFPFIIGGANTETIANVEGDSAGNFYFCGTTASMGDFILAQNTQPSNVFFYGVQSNGYLLWEHFIDSSTNFAPTSVYGCHLSEDERVLYMTGMVQSTTSYFASIDVGSGEVVHFLTPSSNLPSAQTADAIYGYDSQFFFSALTSRYLGPWIIFYADQTSNHVFWQKQLENYNKIPSITNFVPFRKDLLVVGVVRQGVAAVFMLRQNDGSLYRAQECSNMTSISKISVDTYDEEMFLLGTTTSSRNVLVKQRLRTTSSQRQYYFQLPGDTTEIETFSFMKNDRGQVQNLILIQKSILTQEITFSLISNFNLANFLSGYKLDILADHISKGTFILDSQFYFGGTSFSLSNLETTSKAQVFVMRIELSLEVDDSDICVNRDQFTNLFITQPTDLDLTFVDSTIALQDTNVLFISKQDDVVFAANVFQGYTQTPQSCPVESELYNDGEVFTYYAGTDPSFYSFEYFMDTLNSIPISQFLNGSALTDNIVFDYDTYNHTFYFPPEMSSQTVYYMIQGCANSGIPKQLHFQVDLRENTPPYFEDTLQDYTIKAYENLTFTFPNISDRENNSEVDLYFYCQGLPLPSKNFSYVKYYNESRRMNINPNWQNSTAFNHSFEVVLKERDSNFMNHSYFFQVQILPIFEGETVYELGPFSFNVSHVSDEGLATLIFNNPIKNFTNESVEAIRNGSVMAFTVRDEPITPTLDSYTHDNYSLSLVFSLNFSEPVFGAYSPGRDKLFADIFDYRFFRSDFSNTYLRDLQADQPLQLFPSLTTREYEAVGKATMAFCVISYLLIIVLMLLNILKYFFQPEKAKFPHPTMHIVYVTIQNLQCQTLMGFMNIDIPFNLIGYFEQMYKFYFFQIFNFFELDDINDSMVNPNFNVLGFNIKVGKNLISPLIIVILCSCLFLGAFLIKYLQHRLRAFNNKFGFIFRGIIVFYPMILFMGMFNIDTSLYSGSNAFQKVLLIIIFPTTVIIVLVMPMMDFNHFLDKKTWRISGTFYEELDVVEGQKAWRQTINLTYTFWTAFRIAILTFLTKAKEENFTAQLIGIPVITFVYLMYLVIVRPLKSKVALVHQVVVEILTFIECFYMLPLYTSIAEENYSAKINAGRGMFGVGLILLTIHSVVMIMEIFFTLVAFKGYLVESKVKDKDGQDEANPQMTRGQSLATMATSRPLKQDTVIANQNLPRSELNSESNISRNIEQDMEGKPKSRNDKRDDVSTDLRKSLATQGFGSNTKEQLFASTQLLQEQIPSPLPKKFEPFDDQGKDEAPDIAQEGLKSPKEEVKTVGSKRSSKKKRGNKVDQRERKSEVEKQKEEIISSIVRPNTFYEKKNDDDDFNFGGGMDRSEDEEDNQAQRVN